MFKEFYRNPKTGTHWSIYNCKTYVELVKNKVKSVTFYPFPTLRFKHHKDDIRQTRYFEIEFIWLLWEIYFVKDWGKAYREQIELLDEDC